MMVYVKSDDLLNQIALIQECALPGVSHVVASAVSERAIPGALLRRTGMADARNAVDEVLDEPASASGQIRHLTFRAAAAQW
ncbi:MAG TPA: hypothetical protein VHG93_17415 [Longimicrobium sp.]|nr:hypothetical protein [Longimicrobium sp.]